MEVVHREHLTQLQYSEQVKGSLRLYRMGPDGYHTGGIWFGKHPKSDEIAVGTAKCLVGEHLAKGLEVRICNGGDMLVFQAQGTTVLHPKEGAEFFWRKVETS